MRKVRDVDRLEMLHAAIRTVTPALREFLRQGDSLSMFMSDKSKAAMRVIEKEISDKVNQYGKEALELLGKSR